MKRRLALLVSPVAAGGRALRALPAARAELDRLKVEHRAVETRGLDHARQEADAAASAGETVVVVGGDGLIRPVAGVLRRRDAALAIVPGGRGNDLARVLGIPTDPREAARVAVLGEERLLDVAEVNGTPFVGIASLGFDSVANRIANESKLIRGNLVYLYAALRALAGWRHARFEVTIDGERRELTGYTVGVCNSQYYGGGMHAAPWAQLDDGRLDVLTVDAHSKLGFLFTLLPRVFRGTHLEHPSVRFSRGERVEVESDRPFDVYADGDAIAELPATWTIDRRVLRVMVPARSGPDSE